MGIFNCREWCPLEQEEENPLLKDDRRNAQEVVTGQTVDKWYKSAKAFDILDAPHTSANPLELDIPGHHRVHVILEVVGGKFFKIDQPFNGYVLRELMVDVKETTAI